MNNAKTGRSKMRTSLVIAAGLLILSVLLKVLTPSYINNELSQRIFGIMLGLMTLYYANTAPKTLTPLAKLRCDPVQEQALRRFSAWTLVLGGMWYVGAWILLPISVAGNAAIALLGATVLVVVLRVLWVMSRRLRG